MPQVSGQVTSYDLTGKPRDLMDIIFDISPTDTPFLTMCKRSKATQTLHEWTTDELFPPGENAIVEGAETTVFEGGNVREMNNKTQILKKAIQVSGTGQVVKQAGLSNQYRYQMAQRMKEIKKDLEFALLSNKVAAAGSKTVARVMRGAPTFIAKNADLGSGGAVGSESTPAAAGTARPLTETMLKGMIRQCYEAGGNIDQIMAAPLVRSKISEILRADANRTDNIEKNKVSATVEVYVSDYGNLKIVPNRVQASVPYTRNAVLLLDPEYWACAYLRGFSEEKLAKTGDSEKGQIICEATLEARQPDASGMVADIDGTL